MKKTTCLIGALALAMSMLAGCSGSAAEQAQAVFDSTSMDITKIDVDSYIAELGQYSGLTVEVEKKMEINDKMVDSYISYVLENSGMEGEKVEVTRPVETGDVVNIDYYGTKDGVAFDGGTGNYDLTIGSGQFIAGFEDGLIGHEKGETVILELTFPENYGKAELAGQDVEFEVIINNIYEQSAPVLTDEYVTAFGIEGVTDVASFKEYIKSSLTSNAENTYLNGKRDALLNAIYDASKFTETEMPENLLNYYIEQTIAEDKSQAEAYGTTLEEYVPVMYSKDYDTYMAEARETAIVKLRDVMICQKIALLEGITVTDEEVERELLANANQYGYQSVDDFLQIISKEDFRNYLIELKVIDQLLETTTIVEKEDEAATQETTTEEQESTSEAESTSETTTETSEE